MLSGYIIIAAICLKTLQTAWHQWINCAQINYSHMAWWQLDGD